MSDVKISAIEDTKQIALRAEAEEYAVSAAYMEIPARENERIVQTATREIIKEAATAAYLAGANKKVLLLEALNAIAEVEGDTENQQFKLTRFQAAQVARAAILIGESTSRIPTQVPAHKTSELLEDIKDLASAFWKSAFAKSIDRGYDDESAGKFADDDANYKRLRVLIDKAEGKKEVADGN